MHIDRSVRVNKKQENSTLGAPAAVLQPVFSPAALSFSRPSGPSSHAALSAPFLSTRGRSVV